MARRLRWWVLSGFISLLLCSWQQASAILTLQLSKASSHAVPLAVVPFKGDSQLSTIVAKDLQHSGQFTVKQQFAKQPTSPYHVKYDYWQLQDVDNVVIGEVNALGANRWQVKVALLSVYPAAKKQTIDRAGHILFSQTFSMNSDNKRQLAHHISDLIYQKLTGVRGIFSTKIAYVAVNRHVLSKPEYRLMIADYDGMNAKTILRSPQPIMSPVFSPNGKALAYTSFEKERPQIYWQNLSTGQRRLLTNFTGINGAPSFAPNGQDMVVVLSKSGAPKLYRYHIASKKLTQLTFGPSIDTEPAYAPDGQSLLFTSNRGGSPQIYQLNLRTHKISRLTYTGRYNVKASFTPDMRYIVMMHRDKNGNFDIAKQSLQDGQIMLLTKAGLDGAPALAPNGHMAIYTISQGSRSQLAMLSLDGQVQLNLPSDANQVQSPTWSPFL